MTSHIYVRTAAIVLTGCRVMVTITRILIGIFVRFLVLQAENSMGLLLIYPKERNRGRARPNRSLGDWLVDEDSRSALIGGKSWGRLVCNGGWTRGRSPIRAGGDQSSIHAGPPSPTRMGNPSSRKLGGGRLSIRCALAIAVPRPSWHQTQFSVSPSVRLLFEPPCCMNE